MWEKREWNIRIEFTKKHKKNNLHSLATEQEVLSFPSAIEENWWLVRWTYGHSHGSVVMPKIGCCAIFITCFNCMRWVLRLYSSTCVRSTSIRFITEYTHILMANTALTAICLILTSFHCYSLLTVTFLQICFNAKWHKYYCTIKCFLARKPPCINTWRSIISNSIN